MRFDIIALASTLTLTIACGDAGSAAPEVPCPDALSADAEDAVRLYLEAWSEPDSLEQRCAIEAGVADAVVWIDDAQTHEGTAAVFEGLRARFESLSSAEYTREIEGTVTFRHQEALVGWAIVDRDGALVERGQEWLEVDDEGRVARIHTFAGTGQEKSPTPVLLAWARAWNTDDDTDRLDALREAATEDVRFTDLLTDVQGRAALAAEIRRQRASLGGELVPDEGVLVHATESGLPLLARQRIRIALTNGGAIDLVNFIRFRNGRIERLSGYPASR